MADQQARSLPHCDGIWACWSAIFYKTSSERDQKTKCTRGRHFCPFKCTRKRSVQEGGIFVLPNVPYNKVYTREVFLSFQMYHITKCTQGRHFCPSKCTIYMREAFLSFQMYLMSLIKPQLSKPLPSLAVQRNQRERERERESPESSFRRILSLSSY